VFCVAYGAAGDTQVIDDTNYDGNTAVGTGFDRLRLLWESRRDGEDTRPVSELFDLARYHNRWKDPGSIEWKHEDESRVPFLRNFGPLYGELEEEVFSTSFYDGVREPSQDIVDYLDRFNTLAEKKGFTLSYILTPYTAAKEETEVYNWLTAYASEHSIDFYNFLSDAGQQCSFDLRADMSDANHINYRGAFKLTRYLGQRLKDRGFSGMADNPDETNIGRDAEGTYRMLDYYEMFGAGSCQPGQLLNWLKENRGVVAVMAAPQDLILSESQKILSDGLSPGFSGKDMVVFREGQPVSAVLASGGAFSLPFPGNFSFLSSAGKVELSKDGRVVFESGGLTLALYDEYMQSFAFALSVAKDGTMTVSEGSVIERAVEG